MKIMVFGATGGVGGQLMRQGLDAGHQMTAVGRDPAALAGLPPAADIVVIPVMGDPHQLVAAMQGQDAVVSALGPRGRANAGVVSQLTRVVTAAMDAAGVRRILITSAAPVGPVPDGEPFVLRRVLTPIVRAIFTDVYADLAQTERELADTDTDWTIVRAPRLTDHARTGRYRVALETKPVGGAKISRADLAHALLNMITDESLVRHAVGVAY